MVGDDTYLKLMDKDKYPKLINKNLEKMWENRKLSSNLFLGGLYELKSS